MNLFDVMQKSLCIREFAGGAIFFALATAYHQLFIAFTLESLSSFFCFEPSLFWRLSRAWSGAYGSFLSGYGF
jgi:hypothetical protein